MDTVLTNLVLLTFVSYINSQQCTTVSKGTLDIEGTSLVNKKCQFPFFLRNTWYDGCKEFLKYPGKHMCATEVEKNGTMVTGKWGICGESCRINGDIIEGDTACPSGKACISRYQCPLFKKLITIQNRKSQEYESLLQELKGGICNKVGQLKNKRICCEIPIEQNNAFQQYFPIEQNNRFPESCVDIQEERQRYSGTSLPQPGQCGIKCETPFQVIGREDSEFGEFPWAALLGYTIRKQVWDIHTRDFKIVKTIGWKCGGTLINSWYVITAAHCVTGRNRKQLKQVKLGELVVGQDPDCTLDDSYCLPLVQLIDVDKVVVHDGYKSKGLFFDIALIRLKTEAILNRSVQLACLPLNITEWADKIGARNLEDGLVGRNSTVIGWGQTRSYDQGGFKSLKTSGRDLSEKHLQKSKVPVVSNEECRMKLVGYNISDNIICTGGEFGKDACSGDFGGGLFIQADTSVHPVLYKDADSNDPYVQIGVVSYGSQNCGNGKPGVYTRLTHYSQWIQNHLEN